MTSGTAFFLLFIVAGRTLLALERLKLSVSGQSQWNGIKECSAILYLYFVMSGTAMLF